MNPSDHQSIRKQSVVSALRKFAVVRGFIGALSLLSLLATILDIDASEFSRVVFAVLTLWQSFTSYIADSIGLFPFIPEFSSHQINALVFCSVVSVPGVLGIYDIYIGDDQLSLERVLITFALGFISFAGPFLVFTAFLNPAEVAKTNLSDLDVIVFATCLSGIPLIGALVVKGFREGVLYLIGVLLALQVLYFAPVVGEALQSWSDQVLSQSPYGRSIDQLE
ncbi:MAG: hypothetical protein HRT80_14760 [Henriciella sp.]|nr:hypothetical protein [Henriciella sp.]